MLIYVSLTALSKIIVFQSHETNKSNENTNSISLQANLISNNETHENVALSKKSDSIISASYDDSDADPWYLPSSDHSSEVPNYNSTAT